MPSANTNHREADALALATLAWTLSDADRAQRLVDTTGLYPDDLRTRVGEPAVLVAVLDFLAAHEPDLIACADALDVRPEALVAAREMLA